MTTIAFSSSSSVSISVPDPATDSPSTSSSSSPSSSHQAAAYDAELVRRFTAGDEEAFVEIVTRYRRKLFSLAYRRLRNHADAEEIVQDTFMRAYNGLATFRGDCSLSSWLYRIAVNLSCNRHWYFFRRRRQDTLSIDGVFGDDPKATLDNLLPSDAPGPASEAATSELSELVGTCMQQLGQQQRKILVLRNELSQSYSNIAETLGISVGTVKSRIARARTKLRQIITENYGDIGLDAAVLK